VTLSRYLLFLLVPTFGIFSMLICQLQALFFADAGLIQQQINRQHFDNIVNFEEQPVFYTVSAQVL
jgi:hypothetical protein